MRARLRLLPVTGACLAVALTTVAHADQGGTNGNGKTVGSTTTTTTTGGLDAVAPGVATAPGQLKPKPDRTGAEPAGDAAPTTADAPPAKPEAPVRGESVGVAPTDGTVRIHTAEGGWTALQEDAAVPNGTVVDARQGAIRLSAVVDDAGTEQSAAFSGAMFKVEQPTTAHPVTELALRGGRFDTCRQIPRRVEPWASISVRRKPVRRLFGSGHGRFRTSGRFAAATVRGTIWVTEDYCDRTVVHVKRGVVTVKDLRTGRTVDVRAGSSRTVGRR